ncbi:hypothetical protein PHSY_003507 [Pseudozyma hubeiensis SY62]|uniref:Uncharacterized protein n=1 Tax=Pseudozyma hubeiensis (strain SY62) TaxID=1305764 RepID=R9P3R4_PSEHS|nr:hypothetical protein PHSY_003507 [Pseudozyma hubeiensis SY62]GAC95929.1 hypothetical protein PHSY_003507 [Pseudozyma hubeiensis SY62]
MRCTNDWERCAGGNVERQPLTSKDQETNTSSSLLTIPRRRPGDLARPTRHAESLHSTVQKYDDENTDR